MLFYQGSTTCTGKSQMFTCRWTRRAGASLTPSPVRNVLADQRLRVFVRIFLLLLFFLLLFFFFFFFLFFFHWCLFITTFFTFRSFRVSRLLARTLTKPLGQPLGWSLAPLFILLFPDPM